MRPVRDRMPSSNVTPLRPSDRPDAPWWRKALSQWPSVLVFVGIAVGLIFVATDAFRRGSVLMGASVILAAFLRLFLPDRDAGWLKVRSRTVDVAVLGVLGVALTIFAFWVPNPQ